MKSIAVVGASVNRQKYGNKAVRAYLSKGYKVYPINTKEDEIEGQKVYGSLMDLPEKPDIVSIYVPPSVGVKIADEIIKIGVEDIRINPGAESDELVRKFRDAGREPKLICSILAIGVEPSKL